MVFVPGELTNRSPFGAYTIIRGDGTSAKGLTVKPAGTIGIAPSALGTARLGFGLAVPGAGRLLARGCGTTVFCCAVRTVTAATATALAIAHTIGAVHVRVRKGEAGVIVHSIVGLKS
jgi:hypothetical protein